MGHLESFKPIVVFGKSARPDQPRTQLNGEDVCNNNCFSCLGASFSSTTWRHANPRTNENYLF